MHAFIADQDAWSLASTRRAETLALATSCLGPVGSSFPPARCHRRCFSSNLATGSKIQQYEEHYPYSCGPWILLSRTHRPRIEVQMATLICELWELSDKASRAAKEGVFSSRDDVAWSDVLSLVSFQPDSPRVVCEQNEQPHWCHVWTHLWSLNVHQI